MGKLKKVVQSSSPSTNTAPDLTANNSSQTMADPQEEIDSNDIDLENVHMSTDDKNLSDKSNSPPTTDTNTQKDRKPASCKQQGQFKLIGDGSSSKCTQPTPKKKSPITDASNEFPVRMENPSETIIANFCSTQTRKVQYDYEDDGDQDNQLRPEDIEDPETIKKRLMLLVSKGQLEAEQEQKTVMNTLHKAKDDEAMYEKTFLREASTTINTQLDRPPRGNINPESEDFLFMCLDVDFYIEKPPKHMKELDQEQDTTIIRMYGVNNKGNSILVHVFNFRPYFFIQLTYNHHIDQSHLPELKRYLNSKLPNQQGVVDLELVERQSIQNYNEKNQRFIKVYTMLPKFVNQLRSFVEKGLQFNGVAFWTTTYESNLPHALRFMIDNQIVGMSWIKINKGAYSVRDKSKQKSVCQIELDVLSSQEMKCYKQCEGEYAQIAPLRILSFDIECSAEKGKFPQPDRDPIIQIAMICQINGETEPFIRNVFTLKNCAPIIGTKVYSFMDERDLLKAWRDFVIVIDPDIITGYNIVNFDIPYIIGRAESLKIQDYPKFGRIKELFTKFLGEQKEDVQHTIISELQNQNEFTRRRLAIYCIKDAYLPLRLMWKLDCLYHMCEISRVCGVPLSYLFTRGQQIKVASQLYRKSQELGYLIPTDKSNNQDGKYEGAVVIEPIRGFYQDPVAILDFASLYPSIMMAHNLCYSTLIPNYKLKDVDVSMYERTPNGDYFVKKSVKKGVLPIILEELIQARKRVKLDLSRTTDPFEMRLLDSRQNALKTAANSVYGFTGAQVGQLPCLAISCSVTAYGRTMLDRTKNLVKEKFCVKNGYPYDSEVIYGDTDSVMIKFGAKSIEETMILGREAAEYVTSFFENPIKLEFEKIYCPYLLMNKKRYAGLLWTNPVKYDKIDAKGIETVRRDNCPLVKDVVNTVLKKILVERSYEDAINYYKSKFNLIFKCLQGLGKKAKKISNNDEKEAYVAKQAHVELAEKMRKRDEASAPSVGDRVAFVMIKGTKDAKGYEKSEDPLYVLDNNLPIDYNHYLQHQLKQPLIRIFEPILQNPEQVLFVGEHTRTIYVPKSRLRLKRTIMICGCNARDAKGHCTWIFYAKVETALYSIGESRQLKIQRSLEK
ncbi:dna polymerase delta catalytic subunit [Stylonychia lemnae]|uniref:DNA polymerase n=1 Tax=Stylonychia lemnae TaxID=5949 RepID=A0A078A256_STYLE|nr:dna polymerase delta catalytic subunit [Stylonychia lemnae]|eukprot:CDW75907.1 dna polymerase delta catalytic subunit [Stylonychia lemnae]